MKLKYDHLLSSFAFKFNLRLYAEAAEARDEVDQFPGGYPIGGIPTTSSAGMSAPSSVGIDT